MINPSEYRKFIAEHVVKPGETLSGIALRYYKSGVYAKWMAIYDANRETIGSRPSRILAGQRLKIPNLEPPSKTGKILTEYKVEPGDTLSHIALYHYGSARREFWMPIYEANRDIIGSDPSLIRQDQVLKIPDLEDLIWGMRSDQPMAVTFDNRSLLDVDIFWVDYDGHEVYRGTLQRNETRLFHTFVSHRWTIRDSASRYEIQAIVVLKNKPRIEIDASNLRSTAAKIPVSAAFWNTSPLEVNLIYFPAQGPEQRVATLKPGESISYDTHDTAVFQYRETTGDTTVGLFMVSPINRSSKLVINEFNGKPAASIKFNNQSLLTVNLYWHYSGRETLYKTLLPQEKAVLPTFVSQSWWVRDAFSGNKLMHKIIQPSDSEVEITISHHTLRSRKDKAGTPIKALSFSNTTPLTLQIHQINHRGERSTVFDEILPGETVRAMNKFWPEDVFVIVEKETNKEIGFYYASNKNEQAYPIKLGSAPSAGLDDCMLFFQNNTLLTLNVSWFDVDGNPAAPLVLRPGYEYKVPSSLGSAWLVRDELSKRLIEFEILTESSSIRGFQDRFSKSRTWRRNFIITNDIILPFADGKPAVLTVNNTTGFDVNVYGVNRDGTESLLNRQAGSSPSSSDSIDTEKDDTSSAEPIADQAESEILHANSNAQYLTYDSQPIRIRERFSQTELALFLATDLPDQLYSTSIYTDPGAPPKSIRIQNDVGMKLEVWTIEPGGSLVQIGDVAARDSVDMNVRVSQPLLLLDANSGALIDFILVRTDKTTYTVNSDHVRSFADAQHQGVSLALKNTTGFDLDIFRVGYEGERGKDPDLQLVSGENAVVNTHPRQAWLLLERTTGEEVALFLPNGEAVQTFEIEDTLIRRQMREGDLLYPGEVALFSEEEFKGRVWILRNNFSDFSKVIGLDDSISSVKIGPDTGVTIFSEKDFMGQKDDILQELAVMTGTDIGGDNISSIQLWEVVPLGGHGIMSKTGLRESIRSNAPETVETFPSYRSVITFPKDVETVEVGATEQITIVVNENSYTVDAVKSERFPLNPLSKLVVDIEAKTLGTVGLKLRTNHMKWNEWAVIYPDAEVHQKIQGMAEGAIWVDRARLGIKEEVDEATCYSVQKTVKNMAHTVGYASQSNHGADREIAVDGMEYRHWRAAFGHESRPAAYHPISKEEAAFLAENAEVIDEQMAAGWSDFSDFFEDVGKGFVEIVGDVTDTIGDAVNEIVNEAEELGTEASKLVEVLDKAGCDLAKELGVDGLRAIGSLGQAGFEAIKELGKAGVKAIKLVGEEGFGGLLKLGEEGLKILEAIGRDGLEALGQLSKSALDALFGEGFADAIASSLINLGNDLINEVGKAVTFVVRVGEKAVKFVLKTAKQVGEFMEKVWEQIGVAWDKLMIWLDAFFSWGDFLDTHDKILDLFNGSFDFVKAGVIALKSTVTGLVGLVETQVMNGLDKLKKYAGIEDHPEPSGGVDESAHGMDTFEWLMSKVSELMPRGSADDYKYTPEEKDAIHRLMETFELQAPGGFDISSALESVLETLLKAVTDPGRIPQLILGAVIQALEKVARSGFNLLEAVIGGMFDLFAMLIDKIKNELNRKIEIPLITFFYGLITGGRDLSLASLFSLLVAIPATIISKLTLGYAPFEPQLALAQEEGGFRRYIPSAQEKKTIAIVYMSMRFVNSITLGLEFLFVQPVSDDMSPFTEDVMSYSKWGDRLGMINLLFSVGALIMTQMLDERISYPTGDFGEITTWTRLPSLIPNLTGFSQIGDLFSRGEGSDPDSPVFWDRIYLLTTLILPIISGVAFFKKRKQDGFSKKTSIDKYKFGFTSFFGVLQAVSIGFWLDRALKWLDNPTKPEEGEPPAIETDRKGVALLAAQRWAKSIPQIMQGVRISKNPKARAIAGVIAGVGTAADGGLMLARFV